MTLEEINRTLVKAEGGCWHESFDNWFECRKCGMDTEGLENPDFSQWANFGRLLKIWGLKMGTFNLTEIIKNQMHLTMRGPTYKPEIIDQIPILAATELARILREK